MITDGDIRRFVLKEEKLNSAVVKDVMTPQPKYVQEKDLLQVALSTMESSKITSIFAVNSQNKLTGIIHIHTIIEQF